MPSVISPQWYEKASGFFSSSGVKLEEARQSAGTFVGEVTKDARSNVADVTERVGSMVKTRWALLQQPSTRHAVRDRLISAAATTGTLLRRGISGTKDKVVVGKTKVGEVAKKTAQKSKTILTDFERWQKGVASTDGLNSPFLFKSDGDKRVIQQLVSLYNQDSAASVPEGINPVDIAALSKCYLASLPEPLTTFELYSDIKGARSSIPATRNTLKRLPSVNYMTLEFMTALLLCVSQKSLLNKMDSRSLAMEVAPVIMWRKGQRPEFYHQYWSQISKSPSKMSLDSPPGSHESWDMLIDDEGIDASSPIPLDDGMPVDFGAIEVVQLLIEHHNAIFTDANVTVWR